ncbi:MAG: caspase family protein [Anaerolineales bacterium]
MSGKFALIIGNTEYIDPGLAQLTAPGKDTEDFARVLKDQEIGAFDEVNILLNQPEPVVRGAIDEFFDLKKPDDLLVLYFSGHGVRDELGSLYLAVKNTIRTRLRSTAVKSDYIREAMDQSRSRRQVLILDCCNSGAYGQGTKAATGVSIGTASAFEAGYGRIILTASDSTQFAWEGDKVIGETDNSLFTHYLVEGLESEADLDGDGRITVDELYDYVYEKVKLATPKQTPSKFSSRQQGEIVLRQSMRLEDIKPISLPDQLVSEIENPYPEVRLRAVQQLEKLLTGKNLGLARSAREALEKIANQDDSRRVAQAALQALESIRQAEQIAVQKAQEEKRVREQTELLATQKAEEERIAYKREEEERKAREDLERRVREKVEAEWKAQEAAKRLASQKAEEERLAREQAEAERKAKEEAERKAKEEAERLARAKAEREAAEIAMREAAEKDAKEKAEEEAAREKAAREKAEREKAARKVIKKSAYEAKEKETRASAEKRRQKYLELRNKTIHAMKLYYRRILLIAIAVTLIVLTGIFAPSLLASPSTSIARSTLLLSTSTSIPPPTATSLLGSLLSSPPHPTNTRAPIPTNTPVTLPLELIISFEKNGFKKGLSLDTGGDVDTQIVTASGSQARRTGTGKILSSLDGNTTGDSFMQFFVDDSIMYAGTPTTFVLIEIEYFDQGIDDFNVDYDAMGNVGIYKNGMFTDTCKITKGNTLVFKIATFAIKDARFADRDNGADFRITDHGDGAEIIRLVRVTLLSRLNILADSCGAVK